jgi:hypothetical protein
MSDRTCTRGVVITADKPVLVGLDAVGNEGNNAIAGLYRFKM